MSHLALLGKLGGAPCARAPALLRCPAMSLDTALRDTLLDLCRIESVIGNEEALCDHVEARLLKTLPREAVTRFHHSLIVRANTRPGCPKVALVGHLDTVDTVHEGPPRVEGDRIYGCGSADMKSGLAIMLEAVERLLGELLRPGGRLLVKILEGPEAQAIDKRIRSRFARAKTVKTEATRKGSTERYLLAADFRG